MSSEPHQDAAEKASSAELPSQKIDGAHPDPTSASAQSAQRPDTEVSETEKAAESPTAGVPRESEQQQVPTQGSSEQGAPQEASGERASTSSGPGGGPLNLERIRQLRMSQQRSAPKPPKSPVGKPESKREKPSASAEQKTEGAAEETRQKRSKGKTDTGVIRTPEPESSKRKVEVPSRRQLAPELENELSAVLGGSDLDSMLIGDDMLQVGRTLTEGQRVQGRIMKMHGDDVFVSLGGPDEGTIPAIQFDEQPQVGAQVEVIVRGFSSDEGLYELTLPGNAVDVSDWADIREGEVIEALVTGSNSGGLECKVGSIRGFIPASQVAEYRVENLGEMVDQKVLCVVTESNERRGNLVLSRRAVLEREKAEKRAQRLASISVGDAVEGTVTKILDFGAFVDIGGLDGLLHISQLSWERVNHPSEILEVGQKIQVRIEKIDEQSGKIGLSYRSLQEHPWTDIDVRFPVGSVVKGTVTRIAEFGAFVKIATGVEGLVHLSELAHHRVARVSNVVQEGQEVEVKVLSTDAENQRMSLSIKGAQAAPESAGDDSGIEQEETPPPKPALPKHQGPLKGGTGRSSGGEHFGLKW